ncbi:WXG100 family type VII secretion target [Plantactinospora sp. CA-294935]|uniref:WXG100 family type VII secretion target n=1 Tax=Plantactinospora sp. CA-294935 TaxID=3240012 RepID=UPI003D915E90
MLRMYGDPDELDRLAGRLRQRAAEVRERAADHERQGQAARWVSVSAQAYRDQVGRDRRQADQVADELDAVADAVVAHAQEVRELIALIARIEEQAKAWFAATAERMKELAPLVGGPLMKAAMEAPWAGWPVQPGNLPASGDQRWLEVGDFLRGRGVL